VGKELSDELNESALAGSEFVLLDDEEAAGQIASAGDEATLIRQIDESSFRRMDFVFFAGGQETTQRFWQRALRVGASIVDLTYALEHEKDVLVRGPWIAEANANKTPGRDPDLKTSAVVAAHPAAVMLALAAARLRARIPLVSIAATVMEPASEHGRAAMDELHQQTVNLLSFQSLPREQFDAQAAFNLLPALGESATIKLDATERRIREQYSMLCGDQPRMALQIVQAPVFHGYVISAFVELEDAASVAEVEMALAGEHVDVVTSESEPPSNLSAAGQEEIMVRVRSGSMVEGRSKSFWLWLAADNLKLAAMNAIACAGELRKLRPQGKVQ